MISLELATLELFDKEDLAKLNREESIMKSFLSKIDN